MHALQQISRLGLRAYKEAHDSFIGENAEKGKVNTLLAVRAVNTIQVISLFKSLNLDPFICYTHTLI